MRVHAGCVRRAEIRWFGCMDGPEMRKGALADSDDKLSLNSVGIEEGTDKSILAGGYLQYFMMIYSSG